MPRTTMSQDHAIGIAVGNEVTGLDFGFLIDVIRENFNPEQIFEESDLEDWAEENGWVKSS